ncbi:MAG: hypothetical protein PHI13_05820 [Methylococcales bacterium]|nr:hypothetical protein [Methylococcales bacterium]
MNDQPLLLPLTIVTLIVGTECNGVTETISNVFRLVSFRFERAIYRR